MSARVGHSDPAIHMDWVRAQIERLIDAMLERASRDKYDVNKLSVVYRKVVKSRQQSKTRGGTLPPEPLMSPEVRGTYDALFGLAQARKYLRRSGDGNVVLFPITLRIIHHIRATLFELSIFDSSQVFDLDKNPSTWTSFLEDALAAIKGELDKTEPSENRDILFSNSILQGQPHSQYNPADAPYSIIRFTVFLDAAAKALRRAWLLRSTAVSRISNAVYLLSSHRRLRFVAVLSFCFLSIGTSAIVWQAHLPSTQSKRADLPESSASAKALTNPAIIDTIDQERSFQRESQLQREEFSRRTELLMEKINSLLERNVERTTSDWASVTHPATNIDARIAEAQNKLREGDSAAAESLFRATAQDSERDLAVIGERAAQARRNLGAIAFARGDIDDAVTEFTRAIELQSTLVAGDYLSRGNAFGQKGMHAEAIEDYSQAISRGAANAAAYNNRANVFASVGNLEAALDDYDAAIRFEPKDAAPLNGKGNVFRSLGKYQFALEAYNKAIELDPANSGFYNNRGNVYHDMSELDKALDDYAFAINLAPHDPAPHNGRGNVFRQKKELGHALESYNQAIVLDRSYAVAYLNRARLYLVMHRPDDAISDLTTILQLAISGLADASIASDAFVIHGFISAFKDREFDGAINDATSAFDANKTADALLLRSMAHMLKGQYDASLADMASALQIDAELEPILYLLRGGIYFAKGEHEKIIGEYDALDQWAVSHQSVPLEIVARSLRGMSRAINHNFSLALIDADDAVRLASSDQTMPVMRILPLLSRGLIYLAQRKDENAIADLSAIIDLVDTNEVASAINGLPLFNSPPATFVAAAYRGIRGTAYAEMGDHKRAIADYNEVVKIQPSAVRIYESRARSFYATGDYGAAIADYTKAIELSERSAAPRSYFVARGLAYTKAGKQEDAVSDFNEQIKRNPADASAYAARGDARLASGETRVAIEDYTRSIELDSTLPGTYLARGAANLRDENKEMAFDDFVRAADLFFQKREFDEAVGATSKALALRSDISALWYRRGLALESKNEYAGATKDFEKATEIEASNPDMWNSRCWVEAAANQLEQALIDCNKAARLAPNSAAILDSRGFVYLKSGNLERSLTDYNRALALEPKLSTSLYGRAIVQERRSAHKEAVVDLTAAEAIDPEIAEQFVALGIPKQNWQP